MAGCLYQKLASFDTIPAEFTQARNVINRFATDNDGYKVLYDMIQPLLHTNEVLTAPTDADWQDIHEYSTKFSSYINSEALKGRNFAPKEQTQMFIAGLSDIWLPAIRRARSLLDTTSPADPTVPAVLKLAALPTTMEKWLKEETGQSVIRTTYSAQKRTTNETRGRLKHSNSNGYQPDDRGGKLSDKKCPICIVPNHNKYQCILFARYLVCREVDQRVDDNLRNKVVEHFKNQLPPKQTTVTIPILNTSIFTPMPSAYHCRITHHTNIK